MQRFCGLGGGCRHRFASASSSQSQALSYALSSRCAPARTARFAISKRLAPKVWVAGFSDAYTSGGGVHFARDGYLKAALGLPPNREQLSLILTLS